MQNLLLRWCYVFTDGRRKYGQWLNGVEGEAANISRENLAWAVVEAKDYFPRGEVFTIYEVAGPDFVLFQWLGRQQIQFGPTGIIHGAGGVFGLRIRARDSIIDVFTNGEVLLKETNHDYDFVSLKK